MAEDVHTLLDNANDLVHLSGFISRLPTHEQSLVSADGGITTSFGIQ